MTTNTLPARLAGDGNLDEGGARARVLPCRRRQPALRIRRRILTAMRSVAIAARAAATFDASAAHWARFWARRRDRIGREPRQAGARARAPHRALAVSHGDSVRGDAAAAGDRADVQQLVRQVPSGDALVARRALRPVGSHAAARAKPRLVRADSARGARARARQGYAGARWPKMVGPDGRDSPRPSARCSSGSSRTRSSTRSSCYRAQPDRADARTLSRHRLRDRRSSWRRTPFSTGRRSATCSGRR